jgi:AcrR family transcriptional regulator
MTETTSALPGPAGGPAAAPVPPPAPPAPASLRERKKQATRRSLRRIALDLVAERGFNQVTVEDIAAAADVSPRTFFNYFPSKEGALFGADPERTAELHRRIVEEAPGETALEAIRRIMIDEARHRSAEIADLGGEKQEWMRHMRVTQSDPHLRAARAAHMASVEYDIAAAVAERLGTDPDRDPYPIMLASAAMAVMRAAFMFWPVSGGSIPLERFADAACQSLADGLPEDGALRDLLAEIAEPEAAGPPGTAQPTDPAGSAQSTTPATPTTPGAPAESPASPPPSPPDPPPNPAGPPGKPGAAATTSPPNAPAAPAAGSPERTTAHVIA